MVSGIELPGHIAQSKNQKIAEKITYHRLLLEYSGRMMAELVSMEVGMAMQRAERDANLRAADDESEVRMTVNFGRAADMAVAATAALFKRLDINEPK